MNYLMDTHCLIWAAFSPEKLSKKVREILSDPSQRVYFSAVSAWEIALKAQLGKLELEGVSPEKLFELIEEIGFYPMELNAYDAASSLSLAREKHKDPFDRMLIWQAIRNDMHLISKDQSFADYKRKGLKLIW